MPGNRRVIGSSWRAGVAQLHFDVGGGVHRGAVPGQDSVEAGAERVNQRNVAWRSLRTGGAEAHFRVSNGRHHNAVTTQHRLLKALQHRVRLLAHDERADIGVEHISLSEVKKYLLHDVYRILSHRPPLWTENVRNVDELLKHVREMTADNDGFTLIFFGTRLGSELRELTHQATLIRNGILSGG